ncbi:MAG: protein translocase subunit SecD [Desulfovibrionaceae bacterium]
MNMSLRYRILLAAIVLVAGLAYSLPSLPGVKGSLLGDFLPNESIRLGLDLKGGIFLTLEVDTDKALHIRLARYAQDIKQAAEEDQVGFINPKLDGEQAVNFTLHHPEKQADLDKVIDRFSNVFEVSTTERDGAVDYELAVKPDWRDHFVKDIITQTVDIVRNRIDRRGVVEPDIRQQEGGRIQIQLPGMEDAHQAIEVITRMGQLEFKLQADGISAEQARQQPDRYQVLYPKKGTGKPLVVFKDPVLTGEYVADARPQFDQQGHPQVSLELTSRGGDIFAQVTSDNIGKQLAIVLDGTMHSAPVIQSAITGGSASITGSFTMQEVKDLVNVLKDALPAPVNKVAESAIGPSLGQESITNGTRAAVIGLVVVLVFMVIYYGLSGVFADVVLCLNVVLILAGLVAFGATLTLPGIAGIILTIGMAVDANVIIFERIREELRRGLTPKAAIQEGYARATLTIFDANLTTVIAALILYQFGTGPIKGFAVTLTLGIITSMFTAIFVSRILFDIYTANRPAGAKLSI